MSASTSALLRPLLPAVGVGLMVLASGNLFTGATAWGATTGWICVLSIGALGSRSWRDPLALDRPGRWLVAAGCGAALASAWLSPTSRAGHVGLILLPAMLLVPAATRRVCHDPASRRIAGWVLTAVVWAVCLIGWLQWWRLSSSRPAMPLGHHGLLAGWLILVVPTSLGLLGDTRQESAAKLLTSLAGLATLLATQSLGGMIAAATQMALAAAWWPKTRRILVLSAGVVVVATVPRLGRIIEAIDPSGQARSTYLAAAWSGVREHPWLGHGPGSVPWTVADHLDPRAGVNPPSEIVGDLHSLPAHWAFELGLVGFFLAIATLAVFLAKRFQELRARHGTDDRRAAMLGLAGGCIYSLSAAPVTILALPFSAAVVAGLALPPSHTRNRSTTLQKVGLALYLLLAVTILTPKAAAHWHYETARRAATPERARAEIRRAAELDPQFPLYTARWSWLEASLEGPQVRNASLALLAAQQAEALAPLWLEAGSLARAAGADWSYTALQRAYELDPLSPVTAFHLMMARPDSPEAIDLGARAVEAAPVLRQALAWGRLPWLATAVGQAVGIQIPTGRPTPQPAYRSLTVAMDYEYGTSFSIFAFRRSPWPADLAGIPIASE